MVKNLKIDTNINARGSHKMPSSRVYFRTVRSREKKTLMIRDSQDNSNWKRLQEVT